MHIICNVWFQYLYQLSDVGWGNDTQIHQWVIWDGKPLPGQNSPLPRHGDKKGKQKKKKKKTTARAAWIWVLPHCFYGIHHHHHHHWSTKVNQCFGILADDFWTNKSVSAKSNPRRVCWRSGSWFWARSKSSKYTVVFSLKDLNGHRNHPKVLLGKPEWLRIFLKNKSLSFNLVTLILRFLHGLQSRKTRKHLAKPDSNSFTHIFECFWLVSKEHIGDLFGDCVLLVLGVCWNDLYEQMLHYSD